MACGDLVIKCPDSCNFLTGLNGCFKMQRGGGLPVSNFLAMSNFFFFLSELQPPEKWGALGRKC